MDLLDIWPDSWHVVCNVCKKWFSIYSAMGTPYITFSGEGPYIGACTKCQAAFKVYNMNSEKHAVILWSKWRKL